MVLSTPPAIVLQVLSLAVSPEQRQLCIVNFFVMHAKVRLGPTLTDIPIRIYIPNFYQYSHIQNQNFYPSKSRKTGFGPQWASKVTSQ